MVFAGLFPVLADDYEPLRDALGKLKLNDAAFFLRAGEFRRAWFRLSLRLPRLAAHGNCAERLEREFGLNLITTAPSVRYRITRTDGTVMEVDSPAKFPTPSDIGKNRRADHQSHDHHQR